jgi:hypothetical protein
LCYIFTFVDLNTNHTKEEDGERDQEDAGEDGRGKEDDEGRDGESWWMKGREQ